MSNSFISLNCFFMVTKRKSEPVRSIFSSLDRSSCNKSARLGWIHPPKTYLRTLKLFIVNIFVGNLAWGVDDVALREAFEAYGSVDSARVIHDRETGRSRGFGFVEMPNQEEAEAALDGMEGKDLMGRPIRCNESQPRERR